MPLKTLDAQGNGFSTDTISALEYALENGADVVNLSLGASSPSNGEEAAVDALVAAGVAVVAANGNDGLQTNGILYPAAYTIQLRYLPRIIKVSLQTIQCWTSNGLSDPVETWTSRIPMETE